MMEKRFVMVRTCRPALGFLNNKYQFSALGRLACLQTGDAVEMIHFTDGGLKGI